MGNLIFGTTTIQGRKFDNIKMQTSKAGVPRPIIFGRVLPVVGNIIATTKPKIVITKDKQKGGKGGGSTVVENEEIYRSYAIRICEGPVSGISRVWRNNEIVYDRDSSNRTQKENNQAFLKIADFFLGGFNQRPSAVMQAAFGVANAHAYRGTCYLVIDYENLTSSGGAIPQYAFEVERTEGFTLLTSKPYQATSLDAIGAKFTRVRPPPSDIEKEGFVSRFKRLSGQIKTVQSGHDHDQRTALDATFIGVSGQMNFVLNNYDGYVGDSFQATFSDTDGDMRTIVIRYRDADPEPMSSAFFEISGDLQ